MSKDECVAIENYYTQPSCTPTRAAFLTGRYTIRYGMQHFVINNGQNYSLPLTEVTLAEKLANAGYITLGLGKWHLGVYCNASLPHHRGFKHWYGFWTGYSDYFTHEADGLLDLHSDSNIDYNQYGVHSTMLFQDKAAQWIRGHRATYGDAPLFLYYAMQNVRAPLEPYTVDRFSDACKNVPNTKRQGFCGLALGADGAISNVSKELDAAFPGEKVLVIISGDNGAMTTEGGNNCPNENNFCLRGHKGELFEGGIRNSALACSKEMIPSALKGSTYSKGFVHIMDWHKTILNLAEAKDVSDRVMDGVDVWTAMLERKTLPRNEFLVNIDPCGGHGSDCSDGEDSAYIFQGCFGFDPVTDGGQRVCSLLQLATEDNNTEVNTARNMPKACGVWKYLSVVGNSSWDPVSVWDVALADNKIPRTQMLFNLSADPSEKHNLASRYPEIVEALAERIGVLAGEAVAPCNIPSGTCFSRDDAGMARMGGVWAPWLPDP